MPTHRTLVTDPTAQSASEDEPAFIAPPDGARVYHGFAELDFPDIDGWHFGEITPFLGENMGDAFVIAPDGLRADLVWEVGCGETQEIIPLNPADEAFNSFGFRSTTTLSTPCNATCARFSLR